MHPTLYQLVKLKLALGIIITMLIWGCDRQVNPSKPLDQLTIEQINIKGVPSQNITIDQAKKEIIIQIPTSISQFSLPVTYTLGCNNCYLQNSSKGYDWLSLCNGIFDWTIAREGQQQTISYQIRIQPTGPLAASQNTNPIQYQMEHVYFPLTILNYYDGETSCRFTFRNVVTGDTTTISDVFCVQDSTKGFRIHIGSLLPLGNYTIELFKKNGRQLRFPQLLQVQKGNPSLFYIPSSFIMDSPLIKLGGYNLYKEDNIEVLLTSSQNAVIQAKPIDYYGTGLSILPPPGLKPGYYAVQLTQNGQAIALMPYGNLMIVAETAHQPLLHKIYSPGSEKAGPATLERGKTYPISISMNGGSDTHVFLKLVNTNTTETETLIPVNLPYSFFMGSTEGSGVSVDIPSTVTPGRYKVYPRYKGPSEVRDGLVYGWEIEIK